MYKTSTDAENIIKQTLRRPHMPKDSQPDKKAVAKKKAKGQIPITRENKNQNQKGKKKPHVPNNN